MHMNKIRLILMFVFFIPKSGVAQEKLTVRDIYNFNIGDVFEYDISIKGAFWGDSMGQRLTTINRAESSKNDSITYTFRSDKFEMYTENSERKIKFYSTIFDTTFTDLDSTISSFIRRSYKLSAIKYLDTLIYDDSLKTKLYGFISFSSQKSGSVGVGIGTNYMQSYFDGTVISWALRYFKNQNHQFGLPNPLFNKAGRDIGDNKYNLTFTNPSQSFIRFFPVLSSNSDLQITDAAGRTVFEYHAIQSVSELDICQIPSGIYFLTIKIGSTCYTNKLLIHK